MFTACACGFCCCLFLFDLVCCWLGLPVGFCCLVILDVGRIGSLVAGLCLGLVGAWYSVCCDGWFNIW